MIFYIYPFSQNIGYIFSCGAMCLIWIKGLGSNSKLETGWMKYLGGRKVPLLISPAWFLCSLCSSSRHRFIPWTGLGTLPATEQQKHNHSTLSLSRAWLTPFHWSLGCFQARASPSPPVWKIPNIDSIEIILLAMKSTLKKNGCGPGNKYTNQLFCQALGYMFRSHVLSV